MPDKRRHRGPAQEDAQLFAPDRAPILAEATAHLAWLVERGYAEKAALKLVGDRLGLRARQRTAVLRCSASASACRRRRERRCGAADVRGAALALDGFNVLTTIEAALAGGVLLLGRDGMIRDMAGMHGSWRRVEETPAALEWIAQRLARLEPASVHWLLDQPVSNSGRLKALIEAHGAGLTPAWTVECVPDPDPLLKVTDAVVVTADSVILDHAVRHFDLVGSVLADIKSSGRALRLLDLSDGRTEPGRTQREDGQ